ncbi:hypothetical protein NC651_011615 [Populus alba x Populus x berolinensis]|nr:hypothetical protein NC651_011615 [Populus alba x Populus x berolinensis]
MACSKYGYMIAPGWSSLRRSLSRLPISCTASDCRSSSTGPGLLLQMLFGPFWCYREERIVSISYLARPICRKWWLPHSTILKDQTKPLLHNMKDFLQ